MHQGHSSQVTLKDIAETLGCTKAVVSAVLNGSKGNVRVSEALRLRIKAAAEELGYRPNFASQSLIRQRTHTLGIYIDPLYGGGIAGQYHAAILSGIEEAAVPRGYDVLLVNFAGETTVARCIDRIRQARIDGLLLLHTGRNEKLIDAVLEATSFVVAIDSLNPPHRLQAVTFDHAGAVDLAVQHLMDLGHRRIGYAGPFTTRPIPHNLARAQAFAAVMQSRGLECPAEHVIYNDQIASGEKGKSGQFAAERLLAMPASQRPTAMVVYDDILAVNLLRHLTLAGVSVPRDLSMVNFENTLIGEAATPQLTCLDHPVTPMSHHATDRLIDLIEGKGNPADAKQATSEATPWHPQFPSSLVVRGSTAAATASPKAVL